MRRTSWLQERRLLKFADVLARWDGGDLSMQEAGECMDRGHREQVCEDIANSFALFARGGSGCHFGTEAR